MKKAEIIQGLKETMIVCDSVYAYDLEKYIVEAIKALKQEPIKALGEELRKARQGIADEKVLIGFNMAVAICNKHLAESEAEDGKR